MTHFPISLKNPVPAMLGAMLLATGTIPSLLAQSGAGLTGKYYDAADFTALVTTRTDAAINFDFGTSIPSGTTLTSATTYAVAWSGQIEPAHSELYTFHLTADDSARLWVDDQLLAQRTYFQGSGEMRGQIRLKGGHRVNLRVEFIQQTGHASVKLEWASASQAKQTVPTNRLYPATEIPNGGAVMREVWHGLPGAAPSTLTSHANYPAKPASREFLTSFECLAQSWEDSFGTRVTGFIRAPHSGSYTFAVSGDEVVQLYLSTDATEANKTLIASSATATAYRDFAANPSQQSAPRVLVAGQRYFVELLHKEATGADHWSVAWKPPGDTTFSIIPGTVLMMPGTDRATPTTSNYFNTLATENPRLGVTRERFNWLKQQYLSPTASNAKSRAQAIVNAANSDLTAGLEGGRADRDRIERMATAWWLTGNAAYPARVMAILLNAHANSDHTVKWKGLTISLTALGYDWLYPAWTPAERTTLTNYLVTKGFNSQSNSYGNNIGMINDGGFIMSALAVGMVNEGAAEPDLSQGVSQLTGKVNQFNANAGAWLEGTDYGIFAKWGFAPAMESLETALGSSFGLGRTAGLHAAGREPLYIASNARQRFTFSDIGTGSHNAQGWANWWARRFNAPEIYEFSRLVGNSARSALVLPETPLPPAATGLNPDQAFRGPADATPSAFQDVATFRQNWTDPKATFVGGMGGTYMSHGMLQSGTFQLSARGVNWFVDLKSEGYDVPSHNYTTPRSGADRWDYYRNRAEGHNCLIVNPTAQPDRIWNAPPAPMIAYQSAPNGQRSFAVWDLSENVTGVTKLQRGIQLLGQRKQVLIQDEIVHPTPTACWWFAHCPAGVGTEISGDGRSILLTSGTERLWGKIVTGNGMWTVRPALPLPTSPAPPENANNSGYRKLAIQLTNVTNTTLAVWFVPLAPGETAPTTVPGITPLNTWDLAAQNEAPVGHHGGANSSSGAPAEVDLRTLAGDDWTPVTQLTFAVGGASGGTVVLQPDGFTARFTPVPGFNGGQYFTFTATDLDGATSLPATIFIGTSPVIVNWTGTASGSWSQAANWESGLTASSSRGSEVRVLNGINLPAGAAFTSTNDLPGRTQVNALSLRGSHATGSATVTMNGNALEFITNGTAPPRMDLTGPLSGFTYTVNLPLELTEDTTFNGANSGRVNLNGVLSGPGGFTRTGSFTSLYFGNNNTYEGPTVIGTGGLTVGLSGSSSTTGSLGRGDVSTSGTITFQRANAYDVTNAISGPGGIIQFGTGTLTLSPGNTYTGSTQIYAGVLLAESLNSVNGGDPLLPASSLGAPASTASGTIGLGSGASATLRYNGSGETTDRVINLRSTAGGTIEHAGTGLLKFTSPVTVTGASTKTLTLAGSTVGTGELSGAVVDNSTTHKTNLAKSGTGTWTLSGSCTYTGTTTVNAGSLVLLGSIASPSTLTIGSTARLAGSGSLASPLIVNGTLAPGAPFGRMPTTNTVSFGSTARLTWELGGNALAAADGLACGPATITNGARIDLLLNTLGSSVNFLHSFWRTARSFPVVSAATVSGNFAIGTVSTDAGGRAAPVYGSFSLQHTATGVNLLWTPLPGFPVIDDPVITLLSPTGNAVTLLDTSLSLLLSILTSGGSGTTTVWTQTSGPGTATFTHADAAGTHVSFSTAGTYTLRATVTNEVGTTSRDLTVHAGETSRLTLREGEDGYTMQATFVRGDNTSWNSGARDQLLLGRTSAPFRTLLSFDIPPLEPGFFVEGVTLDFRIAEAGSGTGALGPLELRKLHRSFTEGSGDGLTAANGTGTGADWASATGQAPDAWATAGLASGTDYGPTVLASTSGLIPASLTVGSPVILTSSSTALKNAVTAAAGANDPLGLLLKAATDTTLSNHFIRLASNDHATLDWRPQLTLELSNRPAPDADPSTPAGAIVGAEVPLTGTAAHATSTAWSLVSGPGPAWFINPTTVKFSKPGVYALRFSATNAHGESSRTVNVSVTGTALTNLETWRQQHFGISTNAGSAADSSDANLDGENNLLEFATSQNPHATTSAAISLIKNGSTLEYTFPRSLAAVGDGFRFVVRWSDTLAADSWSTAGVTEQIRSDNGMVQLVTSSIAAGSGGRRWLRLYLSKP